MKVLKCDRSRLIAAAMEKIPCDLTVKNIRLVNMFTGEIYPAEVDILDGAVVRVREEGESAPKAAEIYDGGGRFLIPGYIDTHVHIESSMMIPENFGRAVVTWGTTTVCTDPHEIANVMGIDGIRFMLENGRKTAMRHYVLAPSCVPAVPGLESSGAEFSASEIREILDMDDVIGVAEIMDFVGVYNDTERMHSIIDEGIKKGAYLQGHAPGVGGKELAAYIIGGPVSDHESTDAEQVRRKLRNGMHVNLRSSSIVDALQSQVDGIGGQLWHDNVSICSDDVHAKDLLDSGNINSVVRKLVKKGINPVEAIKMGTFNAAREYGFEDLGAIAPGYAADMQLVDSLDGEKPHAVFIGGKLVAEGGRYMAKDDPAPVEKPANTVNMPQITGPGDFALYAPEGSKDRVRIKILTRDGGVAAIKHGLDMELPLKDGKISLEDEPGLQFVCVANRYGTGAKNIAVMDCFDLKYGAMATTVSHDSHNFTVFYRDEESAWACAEYMKKNGGGMCASKDGKIIGALDLPVAGLMSLKDCGSLSVEIENMENILKDMCGEKFYLLMLVVFSLPVLPGLTLTDKGMIDGLTQTFVDMF